MTERVQALGLLVLAGIAVLALWAAVSVLDGANPDSALIQAATALIGVTASVVTGICGFMAGRATANVEHANTVGPVDLGGPPEQAAAGPPDLLHKEP